MTVGFEQAAIRVEKENEFAELKAAIERAFAPEMVGKFLKRLDSRDFESEISRAYWTNGRLNSWTVI